MFSIPFFTQDLKTDIKNQFWNYNTLIIEKNYSKAIDLYANEEFLKLVPKEALIEMINQVFNSPEVQFKIEGPQEIIVDDKIFEEKGNRFVKLTYQQKLEMKLDQTDADNKDNILSALQGEFGADQVSYNEQSGYFEINTSKMAVANSSDSRNWKFSVLEKEMIPFLKQFIPEKFLRDLK